MTMDVYKTVAPAGLRDDPNRAASGPARILAPTRAGFSTLRVKTLLVIFAVTVGLLFALVIPLYTIILGSFLKLEESTTRTDLDRARSALDSRMDSVMATARNWAASDA